MMMYLRTGLACSIMIAAPAVAQTADERAVVAAVEDSVAGWNAGDVDRFMALYSADPSASFVTSAGLVRGKPAMIEGYKKQYDFADAAKRGRLSIAKLDFRMLGRGHALFVGRYTLSYGDGKSASGHTSLVLTREKAGWKVIADHSS